MARRAGELAAAALRHQAEGGKLPPELAALTSDDRVKVVHAAKKVAVAVRTKAGRAGKASHGSLPEGHPDRRAGLSRGKGDA